MDDNRMSLLEKLLNWIRRRKSFRISVLLSSPLIILLIFFFVPFGICVLYSFGFFGSYYGVGLTYYYQIFLGKRAPLYLNIFGRTLLLALFTTAATLILGYPVAYCIAIKSRKYRNALMTLVIVPYWVSYLLRTYALVNILAEDGVINTILLNLGLISEPLQLMYNATGVMIGMVVDYLPFMILPLYASVEKLDVSLLEAAKTLGASPFRTFIHVTLPLTKAGIAAGSILTFIPAVGEYVTPALLGGTQTYYIGTLIWDQFLGARNWWFGSAFSVIFVTIVLVSIIVYMKYIGEEMAM